MYNQPSRVVLSAGEWGLGVYESGAPCVREVVTSVHSKSGPRVRDS